MLLMLVLVEAVRNVSWNMFGGGYVEKEGAPENYGYA